MYKTFSYWLARSASKISLWDWLALRADDLHVVFGWRYLETFSEWLHTDPSLTATAVPPPANPCPDGFSLWEGNCYRVDGTARAWQAAQDQCVSQGGNLTGVADRAEQGFLSLLLRDLSADLWIGLRSEKTVFFSVCLRSVCLRVSVGLSLNATLVWHNGDNCVLVW